MWRRLRSQRLAYMSESGQRVAFVVRSDERWLWTVLSADERDVAVGSAGGFLEAKSQAERAMTNGTAADRPMEPRSFLSIVPSGEGAEEAIGDTPRRRGARR